MLIIRLTDKLSRRIKVQSAEHAPLDANPLVDWCASVFTLGHAPFVMVTNTTTLYTTVFCGKGVTNEAVLVDRMLVSLQELLQAHGLGGVYNRQIMPLADAVVLSKNHNRSVTGSMNDLIRMSKYYLSEPAQSYLELSMTLNTTPMSYLKYQSPDRAFRALLADNYPPRQHITDFGTI